MLQESLPNFLGLDEEDFRLIERYRNLLAAESVSLAQGFTDYLLSHPATAAVFQDFSCEQLNGLIQKQAEHANGLLANRLDVHWRESMRALGIFHQHRGITLSWIAGAYLLYWRHWQETLLREVPESDQNALQDALIRLLIGDLLSQLDGYAQASRDTDMERVSLLNILLGVLSVRGEDAAPQPADLLRRICEALPRESAQVCFAGYVASSGQEDDLTLELLVGAPSPTLDIPRVAGDPCWEVLSSGKPMVCTVPATGLPEWIQTLCAQANEIGFFPFGDINLHGVGLIGVQERGYFDRVGPMFFEAFAYIGDLVLTLRSQSLRDPLTALPNRAVFLDHLKLAQARSLRGNHLLGVALLDLDGFKQVNDRLGHAAGDTVLQKLARRLQGVLRAGDTLARIGGDEFGLLLPDLELHSDLEGLCERLLTAVREPTNIQGEMASVSGSLGVTICPLDNGDADTVIHHADLALYEAKEAGRDQCKLYTVALESRSQGVSNKRALLFDALRENWLLLYYQPIIAAGDGVIGFEALLRLQHPTRGILTPEAFFEALDHPRLARPVGLFVLDAALRQAALWQAQGLSLRIAVNISSHHLLDVRFLDDLQNALAQHATVPPEHLEIEVTESAPLMDLANAKTVLRSCRSLGVRIALDDFGTGYASLTYLQQLPAYTIKLDQGFVRDMIEDPRDLAIVAAVITAGRMLGMEVVAEGVENLELATLLVTMGCSHLQGYAFSPPLPPEAVSGWIAQFQGHPQSPGGDLSMDVLSPILQAQRLRVRDVVRALHGDAPFPAHVIDPGAEDRCHLGRWLRGDAAIRFGHRPEFMDLLARHNRLHELARAGKAALDAEDSVNAGLVGAALEEKNRALLGDLVNLARIYPRGAASVHSPAAPNAT